MRMVMAYLDSCRRMDVDVNGKHLTAWSDIVTMDEARHYMAGYVEQLVTSSNTSFPNRANAILGTHNIELVYSNVWCFVEVGMCALGQVQLWPLTYIYKQLYSVDTPLALHYTLNVCSGV